MRLMRLTKNMNFSKETLWQCFYMRKTLPYQKLDYLQANPLAEHWQLANDTCEYRYSTSKFYEMGENSFSFIKDLRDEF